MIGICKSNLIQLNQLILLLFQEKEKKKVVFLVKVKFIDLSKKPGPWVLYVN